MFSVTAGVVIAGCGGGGSGSGSNNGSPSPSNTQVSSFITDSQMGLVNFSNISNVSGGYSTSASDIVNVYSLTTTASPIIFNLVSTYQQLVSTTWSAFTPTFALGTTYTLTSTGWLDQTKLTSDTLVDSGNGYTATENMQFGNTLLSLKYNLGKTNLAGMTFNCASFCSYPAGAAQYSQSLMSDYYILLKGGVTDVTGAALTNLPASSSTFCDNGIVYQPIIGAATGSPNYTYYYVGGICTQASIANAITSTINNWSGTVLISSQVATTNPAVTVLVTQRWTGPLSNFGQYTFTGTEGGNPIWGVLNGNVLTGFLINNGGLASFGVWKNIVGIGKNKIAYNAELVGKGLTALP